MRRVEPAIWGAAAAYERYVGRWSRLAAAAFVDWLEVPRRRSWIDVGCGTAALAETILAACEPVRVVGIDPAEGFVADDRARIVDERASFVVADAQTLPFDDGSLDAAVSGLVLNFVPVPEAALGEMRRVTAARGVVGAYVWDYAGGMEVIRRFWDAAIRLEPEAGELHEGRRFPLCARATLAELFQRAALEDVDVRALELTARFADFDDYWEPFLGGQGPAPAFVASLPDARRDAIRDALRAELPIHPDGSLELPARAWAARGRVA